MYAFVLPVGGKGTRVSQLTNGKSKAELMITKNKKIIDFQLEHLIKYKKKILILSNSKQISLNNYIEKKYSKNGVKIILENNPKGTAGCLTPLKKLHYKFFIVVYGDIIFNLDFKKFIKFHKNKKSNCTLIVHPNNHPYDSDTVKLNKNNKIEKIYLKPHKKKYVPNLSLAGINIVNKDLIKIIDKKEFQDFSKDFLPIAVKKFNMFGYYSREYIKDAGTKDRIIQIKKELNTIKYTKGNLNKKIPAIFLDKDGVINELNPKKNYQKTNNVLKNVGKSLNIINKSGYLSVIITNQPAIAKGFVKEKKFQNDINKLSHILSKDKSYFDKLYYCPHHPEKGFKREIKKLKIKCNCRKPKNGLFLKAIKDLNIDYKKSFVIGDQMSDYYASKKTKLKFVGVNNTKIFNNNNILNKKNLFQAVKYIFNSNN